MCKRATARKKRATARARRLLPIREGMQDLKNTNIQELTIQIKEEFAKGMLIEGDSVDKIVKVAKLSTGKVEELKEILRQEGKQIKKDISIRAQVDEVMKFLFSVSKRTLVLMINNLFNEDYDPDSVNITLTNSEFVNENLDVIRGDLFFQIDVDGENKSYYLHAEIQTAPDGSMCIRLLDYDIRKAAEIQRLSGETAADGEAVYVLPKSIVIHIEKSESIPNEYKTKIVDVKPDGTEEVINRVVPVVRYWELSFEELVEKKLYPLLPMQVFLLRGKLKKFSDAEMSKEKQQSGIKSIG